MAEKQEDQEFIVTEAINKAETFIDSNKKSLGIIIGALVLAVGGYLFYQKVYVAGKEKDAEQVFFKAENYFNSDSLRLAINGDGNNPGFEEIASDYSVAPSGNLSRYYLGMAYLRTKEYEKAIDALKSYDAKDEISGALVLGAIGDAYFEMKNVDEAVSYYEKASKENPNTFTTPLMMMKWASALESKGDYKEAKAVYESIKKEYASTPEGTSADKYIARASALSGEN